MIELFKQPNLDWMGKAKYFFALSGFLLLLGLLSWFQQGRSLRYGIDFKEGTNVDVRFAQPPDMHRLRKGLAAQGLGNSEIQSIRDIASPNSSEVLIFVEQKGQGDQALDASKALVLTALNATYGVTAGGKPDFNASTESTLAAFLTQRDPLGLSAPPGDPYQQLAKRILQYRDKKKNGVLTSFDSLASVTGGSPAAGSPVQSNYTP